MKTLIIAGFTVLTISVLSASRADTNFSDSRIETPSLTFNNTKRGDPDVASSNVIKIEPKEEKIVSNMPAIASLDPLRFKMITIKPSHDPDCALIVKKADMLPPK